MDLANEKVAKILRTLELPAESSQKRTYGGRLEDEVCDASFFSISIVQEAGKIICKALSARV
jgi:hypothetical protein